MEVRKIMTKNPACCTSDSTLQEVAHMMEMYDCGCIPVVEDHKTNKPIGTITDRDIAIRAVAENQSVSQMKASDIMTTDIATVTPETTVEQCRDQMEERQIRRILVVDKSGKCVGIVAQADVVLHESNPQQTSEFIRDISQTSGTQYGSHSPGSYSQPSYTQPRTYSNSRFDETASERESYRNFSNQNRGYEQDYSRREDHRSESFSKPGKKFKKVRREEKSFFRSSTLLPLLIAVGAGAALKYYMGVDEKSRTTFVPRNSVTSTVDTTEEVTPKVSIELPTETQTKIDMVDGRDTTLKTGAAIKTGTSSAFDKDSDTSGEIGRTAKL